MDGGGEGPGESEGGGDFQVGQKAPEGLGFLKAVSEECSARSGCTFTFFVIVHLGFVTTSTFTSCGDWHKSFQL